MCPVMNTARLAEPHWLTAIAVFALLIFGSPAAFTQSPTLNPTQNAAPTLAETLQSQPSAIEPAFQTNPEDVGDALMLHQRYQAAREAYSKAVRTSRVWNKMGIADEMMFNLEHASHCFKEAIKLDRKNAHALNNLGTLYASSKQFNEAEHMYRKALLFEPGSAIIHKNLGTDLVAQHKYKEGWENYQAALVLDRHVFDDTLNLRVGNPITGQDRGAVNYYLARGCVRAGQNDLAIDYLRRALDEGFTNPRKIVADTEFATLRGVPAFEQLLAAQGAP
jgi:tetratricopeptide (TPR) repeat protein